MLNGVTMLHQELEIERNRNENLSKHVHEMQVQYDSDNEVTNELRKKIIDLENALSEGLEKANNQKTKEQAMLSRLRTLLEQSEASRQQCEYSVLIEKKKIRETMHMFTEQKEKHENDILRYKSVIKDFQNQAKEWENAVLETQKTAEVEISKFDEKFQQMLAVLKDKENLIEYQNFELSEKQKHIDALTSQIDALKFENNTLMTKAEDLKTSLHHQKQQIKQYALKESIMLQKEDNFKKEMNSIGEEIKTLQDRLQKERGVSIQSSQQVSCLEEKIVLLEKEKRELQENIETISKINSELTSQLDVFQSEIDDMRLECKVLTSQHEHLKADSAERETRLESQVNQHKKHSAELQSDLERHQTICANLGKELNSLQYSMEEVNCLYGFYKNYTQISPL